MNMGSANKAIAIQLQQAITSHRQGNLPQALWLFQQVLTADPYNLQALAEAGQMLNQMGRFEEALNCFNRAAIARPDDPAIYYNSGTALRGLERYESALNSFDKAIALKPAFAEAHDGRGNTLDDLQRYEEALVSFNKAIECNKKFAIAYNNRGVLLHEKFERYDEALISLNKAVALQPNFAEAHYNRALLLYVTGRHSEALAGYERALYLNPGYIEARYNKGTLKLLLGDFQQGWPLYEFRWIANKSKEKLPPFKQPLWLGDQPVTGKTLLLHAEQGYGDTLQFVRYVLLLAPLAGKIILKVPAPLVPLLSTLDANITLITKGDSLPPFDLHCPLMSLPLAFRTTVESIPGPFPYLSADPEMQADVLKRLGPRVKPRIGLVWSGNPAHLNDHNRSMPLQALKPLLELDYEFHSLHKEIRPEEQALLSELTQIHSHQDELHDYACTAALISAMDLIICVDTSVVHLAGALGKKVWLLLPLLPDWRWMLEREDSPWYPSARLFRQRSKHDWSGLIDNVIAELQTNSLK
ncbi:MAG: tetratricopeptide repeat protein [Pseudomonadota bacterium]|nr:tetratricopeptide repeat protein [Pseudomonadota bacterium]